MYPGKAYQSIVNKLLNLLGSTLVAGDLIQATAANTLARLAIGANNRFLGVDGSGVLGYRQVQTADIVANAITQVGFTSGSTGSISTTSGTDVAMSDMSVPLTTTGGDLLAWFTGTYSHSVLGSVGVIGLALDGGGTVGRKALIVSNAGQEVATMARFTGVAAGPHTVRAVWATTAPTLTDNNLERHLMVMEIKR
jgi:hypothetical protein